MRRPIIFVFFAGFAGLVAALVVYSALPRRGRGMSVGPDQLVIVVAAHHLTIDSKLDQNSIKTARWSQDSVPPGAFTDPGDVTGQYTKTDFVENEPIVASRLTKSPNGAKIPSPVD